MKWKNIVKFQEKNRAVRQYSTEEMYQYLQDVFKNHLKEKEIDPIEQEILRFLKNNPDGKQ